MRKVVRIAATIIALIIICFCGLSLWINQNNEVNDIASNNVFCEIIGYDKSVPSLGTDDFYVCQFYYADKNVTRVDWFLKEDS